ncbi:MAG: DNA replication/repair protein RecF [Oscillospiraceae bacterium]|nr:DNA replication/repair protein RecF [Oscillospiraceae bacterium]
MTVKRLSLDGFRNYNTEEVHFCDGINVINGRNAQGKTNLIEAIYYLATGKSFRGASDKELISFNRENACIRADIKSSEREQTLEARFFCGRRREIYANEVKLKKTAELAGRLTAVLFYPDDLAIIKEGASVRRKLMDNSLSQLRPGYLAAFTEFGKLYDHKTRILRDHYEKPQLLELLDDFNIRLAEHSAQLIYYRAAFAKKLSARASIIHKEFSNGQEELVIRYKTVGGMDAADKTPQELLPSLLEHQKNHYNAELRSGLCLSGAHKDDLEIEINGNAARKYASQGQTRTAAVSIKLAERDIFFDDRGEYPVLLLDDVLSELDTKRQEFILGRIKQGQVFVTCCDDAITGALSGGKALRIENGELS